MSMNAAAPTAGFGHDLWVRVKNLFKGSANSAVSNAENKHIEDQLHLSEEQERAAHGKYNQGAIGVFESSNNLVTLKQKAEARLATANTRADTAAQEAQKAQAAGNTARYNEMAAAVAAQEEAIQSETALIASLQAKIEGLDAKKSEMVVGAIHNQAAENQHKAEDEVAIASNKAVDGETAAMDATDAATSAEGSAAAVRQRAMDNVQAKENKLNARKEFSQRTGTSDLDQIGAKNKAADATAARLAKFGVKTAAPPAAPEPAPAVNPNGTLTML